ncbi:MAG TPA: DNA double-strand break repair nuclease NurA [Pyrinomonadaceae bacterium]|jgi:hypothetical protein
MLYRQHVIRALDKRRDEFVSFERSWRDGVSLGARLLRALGGRSSDEIAQETEAARAPGARPSAELDERGAVGVSFGREWRSHEEARRWAVEALSERTTFAADGSQLLPGREISLPVAGVQVAWFENPHTRDGSGYRKEVHFSVVTPRELLEAGGRSATPETVVSFQRFELETKTLCDFLRRRQGWRERGERMPLAFFDGTLLISYTHPRTKVQDRYVEAIIELVKLSRKTQVPVVGYIDQSMARDLVNLLDALYGSLRDTSVFDAQLLRAASPDSDAPPALPSWGDRSIFCYCLREGLTEDFRDEQGEPLVGFVYLQTTGEGAPARLDVPTWVYEAGLLDEVLDAVRAECVVGNGYPYALETADAAAVITSRDREQFLRVMQEFAERESFAFRVSRKATSKARRR